MTKVNASPGFDFTHLVAASASRQDAQYATTRAGARLYSERLQRIETIPGVQSAAVALTLPYARPLNVDVSEIGWDPVQRAITDRVFEKGQEQVRRLSMRRIVASDLLHAACLAFIPSLAETNADASQHRIRQRSQVFGAQATGSNLIANKGVSTFGRFAKTGPCGCFGTSKLLKNEPSLTTAE